MDTETKYRNALMWAFDRLSIDDMTKREQQNTMLEIGNVLTGKLSPATTYVPNDWDDSAKLDGRHDGPSEEAEAADAMQSFLYHEED